MKLHSVLWIEDDPDTRRIMLESFSEDREERGFNIMPHEFDSWKNFTDNSDIDLSMISMALVCVDYNLPGGINGNDVIKKIRSYQANVDVNIIFYSYSKNEEELKVILENTLGKNNMNNIFFAHQDDLEDRIILLMEDL